ncbi:hypothetical protein ANTRET_LOCUS4896 [Anthophora retusa]
MLIKNEGTSGNDKTHSFAEACSASRQCRLKKKPSFILSWLSDINSSITAESIEYPSLRVLTNAPCDFSVGFSVRREHLVRRSSSDFVTTKSRIEGILNTNRFASRCVRCSKENSKRNNFNQIKCHRFAG